MKTGIVHCCVTSPPYWKLRDYGHPDQIGSEKDPYEYVYNLVQVFQEVKRVLRDDGTLWLNLGDRYAQAKGHGHWECRKGKGDEHGQKIVKLWSGIDASDIGLKPKDLIGLPWRVAFALQADGWYLRSDIIWNKPNATPTPVRDRCTSSHEYIFMLSKSPKYYWDQEAVKEPSVLPNARGNTYGTKHVHQVNPQFSHSGRVYVGSKKRNRRDVWTVTTKSYKEAHFATFPPDLIEPCILAGCPVGGVVLDPFAGAGTVGLVCAQEGRNSVLIDIKNEYALMSKKRIEGVLKGQTEVFLV